MAMSSVEGGPKGKFTVNGGVHSHPAGERRNGDLQKEPLNGSRFEIRLADLERDARAIAKIWSQRSVIGHLSGIAPVDTNRDIKRFREDPSRYISGTPVEPNEIIIASEDDVKRFLKSQDPSKTKILVAVGSDSKVHGTLVVEKVGKAVTYAGLSRLAVDEDSRGKKVAMLLATSGIAIALCKPEDGGWGYYGVSAGIIMLPGSEKPISLFKKLGFKVGRNEVGEEDVRRNGCVSWSNDAGLFVPRDVKIMALDADNYNPDPKCLAKLADRSSSI